MIINRKYLLIKVPITMENTKAKDIIRLKIQAKNEMHYEKVNCKKEFPDKFYNLSEKNSFNDKNKNYLSIDKTKIKVASNIHISDQLQQKVIRNRNIKIGAKLGVPELSINDSSNFKIKKVKPLKINIIDDNTKSGNNYFQNNYHTLNYSKINLINNKKLKKIKSNKSNLLSDLDRLRKTTNASETKDEKEDNNLKLLQLSKETYMELGTERNNSNKNTLLRSIFNNFAKSKDSPKLILLSNGSLVIDSPMYIKSFKSENLDNLPFINLNTEQMEKNHKNPENKHKRKDIQELLRKKSLEKIQGKLNTNYQKLNEVSNKIISTIKSALDTLSTKFQKK